jgi:hypothetical protein
LAGALNHLQVSGLTTNIYVVLTGAMTPPQKQIGCKKKELNTGFYLHLVGWFKDHHPGFKEIPLECPEIHLVKEPESIHNTNTEADPSIEEMYGGAEFYFTSGKDPTKETSVFRATRQLAIALFQQTGHLLL